MKFLFRNEMKRNKRNNQLVTLSSGRVRHIATMSSEDLERLPGDYDKELLRREIPKERKYKPDFNPSPVERKVLELKGRSTDYIPRGYHRPQYLPAQAENWVLGSDVFKNSGDPREKTWVTAYKQALQKEKGTQDLGNPRLKGLS